MSKRKIPAGATPIKLRVSFPEAMRAGARLGRKLNGSYIAGNSSCALGAVGLAMGFGDNNSNEDTGIAAARLNKRYVEKCPGTATCHEGYTVQSTVIHLNDNHRWSRERIADWLETTAAHDATVEIIAGYELPEGYFPKPAIIIESVADVIARSRDLAAVIKE